MKRLALLGMMILISGNAVFAEDQCGNGTEVSANESKSDVKKSDSDNRDSENLHQEKK